MKINKKYSILIIFIILVIAVLGYMFYISKHNDSLGSVSNVTQQKGAEEVAQNTKDTASQTADTDKPDTNQPSNNSEPPPSNSQLPSNITLSIKSFEQTGGVIRAVAIINSSDSGVCYFGFSSPDTKPVSRTNQSASESNNQNCTVEIPESEFTKLGSWNMTISFTKNSAKVESSQNVTIN